MNPIVYGASLSPFVRKVRLCLLEKALGYQLENVMPFTPPAWYYALSPLGRIPAYKDEEATLADSSVICQYLEEAHPDTPHLYGETAPERARIRWLEKYADYEIAPIATFCIFANRILRPSSGKTSNEDSIRKALEERLPPHFDYLERQLGDQAFFLGDHPSMADLALASQLLNMEYGGERPDASRWPALAAHHARIRARESVQSLLGEEARILGKLREMASVQNA